MRRVLRQTAEPHFHQAELALDDAERVFEACVANDVAVEINSRPERADPPDDLLVLALEAGCLFAIDSDAHAPGQLDFLDYGAERAERLDGEHASGGVVAIDAAGPGADEAGDVGQGVDAGGVSVAVVLGERQEAGGGLDVDEVCVEAREGEEEGAAEVWTCKGLDL